MTNKTFFLSFGIMILGIMGIFLFSSDALAQLPQLTFSTGNSVFNAAYNQLYTTFRQARVVVYILSGFGLIGFAVAAVFNKISFTWLTSIAVALFVLAAADKIVEYIVTAGSDTFIMNENPHYEGDKDFNLKDVDNSFDLRFNDLL